MMFLLVTTAAWALSAVIGLWLLMQNYFAAEIAAGLLPVLIISLSQYSQLKGVRFVLWLLANGVGLVVGILAINLADLISVVTLVIPTGLPIPDWLIGFWVLFLLTAVGVVPGGLVAGVLKRWAVGKGGIGGWIVVSISNWSLSFGAAGALVWVTNFYQHFSLHDPLTIPLLLRVALIGSLIGIIQGGVLGTFLGKVNQQGASSTDVGSALMWRRMLLFLFFLPSVGCLLGFGIAEILPEAEKSSWESFGTPPSPAVRFVQASPLVVAAENGEMYRLRYKDQTYGWEVFTNDPSEPSGQPTPEFCEDITPPPLDGVVDSVEKCGRLEFGSFYRNFAVLEDGSVWMWSKNSNAASSELIYTLIGSLGFFVLGLLVMALMSILKPLQTSQNERPADP